MELFKWLIDIEEKYDMLIEDANNESEAQISQLKSILDSEMESIIADRKNFIDTILNTLMNDLKENITLFKESSQNEIEILKNNYLAKRKELIQTVLKKLGYDF